MTVNASTFYVLMQAVDRSSGFDHIVRLMLRAAAALNAGRGSSPTVMEGYAERNCHGSRTEVIDTGKVEFSVALHNCRATAPA